MGNGQSYTADYKEAVTIFTEGENQQISAIFAGIKGPEKHRFNDDDFKTYCTGKLSDSLEHNLFMYMLTCIPEVQSNSHSVDKELFVVSMAHILKGSLSQHTALIEHLISSDDDKSEKNIDSLLMCLKDLLAVYPQTMSSRKELSSWKLNCSEDSIVKLSQYMVEDIRTIMAESKEITSAHIEKWLSSCGLMTHVMESVFHHLFPVSFVETVDCLSSSQPLFPIAEGVNWSECSTILDIPSMILLSYSLPHDLRSPWRLLFHSDKHGESFSTLLKFIRNKGPCIVLLKDTDGHVFGGFATESLSPKPQFSGNSYSFLFSLHPHMNVYTATGHNENYLYLNQGQETMPNGLGFGGQLNYFGLWLDHDYGCGHSKANPNPCSTYGSPQLSGKEVFHFNYLEVWGVGKDPNEIRDDEDSYNPGSILDKDPEAKAMLSLLDRGPHSEGLREQDQLADTPEQHTLQT